MKEKNLVATLQKSYYGKAKVIEDENGGARLKSYETIVCAIDASGNFKRLWGGYSRTTINHVNDFRALFGFESMNKKEWMSCPCENGGELYKVEMTNGFVAWKSEVVFDSEAQAEAFAEKLEKGRGGVFYAYPVQA